MTTQETQMKTWKRTRRETILHLDNVIALARDYDTIITNGEEPDFEKLAEIGRIIKEAALYLSLTPSEVEATLRVRDSDGTCECDNLRCGTVMPARYFTALDSGRKPSILCPNCYVAAREQRDRGL